MTDKTASGLTIKQNMLWNMMGSAIGLACQWIISILVVRLASDMASAGIYSLAMSVYAIFSPIANFGLYTYIITEMEDRFSIGEYVTLCSLTSSATIIVTTVYAMFTCRSNAWTPIAIYAIYKGIATVLDILHAADQRAHRMDFIGISLAAQGILSLLGFIAFFLITDNLTITIGVMALLTLAVGLLYDLPKARSLYEIKFGITKKKALAILSGCALIVVANMANGAFASLPRQSLSTIMGDSALGIYASVATPVAIIQVGATYIYNPLIGYFAEAFHQKDKRTFAKYGVVTIGGIALVGIMAIFGGLLLGRPVLNLLYGSTVASYSHLLTPLIVSSIFLGIAGFLSQLLVAVRSLRLMLIGGVAALIVSLVSSHPLVIALGMNGATLALILATLTSIAISLIGIAIQTKERFKRR